MTTRLERALDDAMQITVGEEPAPTWVKQAGAVLALITSEEAREAMKVALHAALDKAADPDAEYEEDEPWSVEECAQAALVRFLNESVDE